MTALYNSDYSIQFFDLIELIGCLKIYWLKLTFPTKL